MTSAERAGVRHYEPSLPAGAEHGRRVAALDLGSNSFHLIIARLERDGPASTVARFKHEVQLGRSVFARGRISEPAFVQGLAAVDELAVIAREHEPEALVAVATSALREAGNGREWVACANRRTGLAIRIVSGREEARLMLLGTRQSIALEGRRVALFDLGGGSTEVIVADDERCVFSDSLRLGTLRLRNPNGIATRATELARMHQCAAETLRPTLDQVKKLGFDRLVLSCGVARKLLQLAPREVRSTELQAERHFEPRLSLAALDELVQGLAARDEPHSAGPDEAAERIDTLLPGAIALRALLDGLGSSDALISTTGLREGLIVDYALSEAVAPQP